MFRYVHRVGWEYYKITNNNIKFNIIIANFGSECRIRTYDQVINSHLLYHWANSEYWVRGLDLNQRPRRLWALWATWLLYPAIKKFLKFYLNNKTLKTLNLIFLELLPNRKPRKPALNIFNKILSANF